MTEIGTDYWLSEATLESPKRQVGDYVENEGFAVPRRFDTLDDALKVVKAGGRIAIRSEHPDEYDGASGLMQTYILDSDSPDEAVRTFERYGDFDIDEQVHESQNRSAMTGRGEMPGYATMTDVVLGVALHEPTDVTLRRLKELNGHRHTVRRYADITGRRETEFMGKANFSFWEYVPGLNATVVADTAVDNRYHIFADRSDRKPVYMGWKIANDEGNSIAGKPDDAVLTPEVTAQLVNTYEQIRNLPHFDSNHCPIMELQLDENGQIWFLQYHRTQDFKATHALLDPADFSTQEGWQKADGVRGALDSPATMKTALWYPEKYGTTLKGRVGRTLPESEDAAVDWHWDLALTEALSRHRLGYVADNSLNDLYRGFAVAHGPRSRWFKPQSAIACNDKGLDNLIPETLKKEISLTVHREHRLARVVLDVAVDGTSGYVRLNPDAEQPLIV